MCISVFALVTKNNEKDVLMGIPKKINRWRNDWLYAKGKSRGGEIFEEWRLPSCYLREGEHPENALGRIMGEQLGIRQFETSHAPRVFLTFLPPIGT